MTNFSIPEHWLELNPELAQLKHKSARLDRPARKVTDDYDSQLERDYSDHLLSRGLWYRRLTKHDGLLFHLADDLDYTPDYIFIDERGRLCLAEVKGNKKQKNARDSRTRWKAAAERWPCFRWLWIERKADGQWVEQVYAE